MFQNTNVITDEIIDVSQDSKHIYIITESIKAVNLFEVLAE